MMKSLRKPEYSSLSQEDTSLKNDKHEYTRQYDKKHGSATLKSVVTVLIAIFCFMLGFLIRRDGDGGIETKWTTGLPKLKRVPTRFNGSFEFANEYRGKPSPELDRAWDRFTAHPLIDGTASLIAVSKQDIMHSGKTTDMDWINSTVKYIEADGGGYMATLEVFHQLHCLNMLRKSIHSDYYENMRAFTNGTRNHILVTHLDHCIEIIRQVLSCNADTGLITFHWVKDNPVPYPDFNNLHQCRDPEDVLAWSQAREVPATRTPQKQFYANVVEMPSAP